MIGSFTFLLGISIGIFMVYMSSRKPSPDTPDKSDPSEVSENETPTRPIPEGALDRYLDDAERLRKEREAERALALADGSPPHAARCEDSDPDMPNPALKSELQAFLKPDFNEDEDGGVPLFPTKESCEELLQESNHDVDFNNSQFTLLHAAFYLNETVLIRFLLERRAYVRYKDMHRNTPLHLISSVEALEMVKEKHLKDLYLRAVENDKGETPLQTISRRHSCSGGNPHVKAEADKLLKEEKLKALLNRF